MENFDNDFWEALDELIQTSEIAVDRPKGSRHPKYPDVIYPADYGYLQGTASMDGEGIDLWLGTAAGALGAVVCTVDLLKSSCCWAARSRKRPLFGSSTTRRPS